LPPKVLCSTALPQSSYTQAFEGGPRLTPPRQSAWAATASAGAAHTRAELTEVLR